ncbi:MAG TPA: hemerythrin [Persephonella sp.]|nr:hemerythrin [Hydrogenothermaceae bacterium]HIQ25520.1 hemerythrin [Persephonella sp.]
MLLKKEELPVVPKDEMNEIHYEEVDIINDLYNCAINENLEKTKEYLEEFINHIEDHFSFEEELMEQNEFFAYPIHKMEHDNVLSRIYNIKKQFEETNDTKVIAKFLENEFVPWLINHLNTMDMATASFLGGF